MLIGITLLIFILLSFQTAFSLIARDNEMQNNTKTPAKTDTQPDVVNSQNIRATSGTTLFDTVKHGGAVMIPIMILAVLGLTFIIERIIFYVKSETWKTEKIKEHISKAKGDSRAKYREELENELQSSVQIYINKMERGLGMINGIGNLAPILGFFGTVIGMIKAFAAIAAATTVNAKVVAVGIQIALVTTAGGLAVAVPTLFFFHFFNHIIHKTNTNADNLIEKEIRAMPYLSSGNEENSKFESDLQET